MPAYQDQKAIPGLISSYTQTDAADCGSKVPYVRQVPDVAADADPDTNSYLIRYQGSWQGIGGTSGAAPLWAGAAALTDASPFCRYYDSGNPGVLPEGLYAFIAAEPSYEYSPPPEVVKDVTKGGNDYTSSGYTGGLYPATRGYDMAIIWHTHEVFKGEPLAA